MIALTQEMLFELYAHYCAASASVNLEEKYTDYELSQCALNYYRTVAVAMGAQDARNGYTRTQASFEAAYVLQVKRGEP